MVIYLLDKYVVRLVYIFLFQTHDNDSKHLVVYDISCGL